ncbi:hypothetical protein BHE74_00020820 [Ensete ventricosum]|nr:hypothetical protein GW17_00010618 [Ensete ventricosum]RWW71434.1 hypothetical protein BHE74_00020820 [Ensete ventricosum]RZR95827.1 hypothetical protein BHM03_00024723 [Ensete ventricosum]
MAYRTPAAIQNENFHIHIGIDCISKKFLKVVSDLHEWLSASYDLGLPEKVCSLAMFSVLHVRYVWDSLIEMEHYSEHNVSDIAMTLLNIWNLVFSGYEEVGNLLESEVDHLHFLERPIELELKED